MSSDRTNYERMFLKGKRQASYITDWAEFGYDYAR
jgi:hypothetical protein